MGRRSLATNPRVPWAMHAVVHVMEMQRRFEDAVCWRLHQPAWAEANGFACHLWWHESLFRLGRRSLCRALINERRMAKPMAPLTRHWMDQLDIPEAAR